MIDQTTTPEEMRAIERVFLENAWGYGTSAHELVAETLAKRLDEEMEPEKRHLLVARLYAEYAASLETYGAWAWSVQNRSSHVCFLEALLRYRVPDVRKFYEAVDRHTDLIALLSLPPAELIADAVVTRSGGEITRSEVDATLCRTNEHLSEASGLYLRTDSIIVDAYNKTKHGLPIIRNSEEPTRFHLIVNKGGEWIFPEFNVTDALIEKLRTSVPALRTWIGEIAALTRILNDADLLYVPLL